MSKSRDGKKYEVRLAGANWAVGYVWGEFADVEDFAEVLEFGNRFSAQAAADMLQAWHDAGVLL